VSTKQDVDTDAALRTDLRDEIAKLRAELRAEREQSRADVASAHVEIAKTKAEATELRVENTRLVEQSKTLVTKIQGLVQQLEQAEDDKRTLVAYNRELSSQLTDARTLLRESGVEVKSSGSTGRWKASK
jgi:chromosome segregation ATPase